MTLPKLLANGGRELVNGILREMPYREYLLTDHWRAVREATLRRAHWSCRMCGGKAWQAHHLTYERRGEELPEDTVALCDACHKMWHETWQLRVRAEGEQQFRE